MSWFPRIEQYELSAEDCVTLELSVQQRWEATSLTWGSRGITFFVRNVGPRYADTPPSVPPAAPPRP